MTPRNVIDHERRRYEDDKAYTLLRWFYSGLKLLVVALFGWFLARAGSILIEHKPLMAKVSDLSACAAATHDTLQHHGFVIDDHERRIEKLEDRRRNH